MSNGRTLILCVDRDDDIGYKGKIASPVIGRDACLAAANTLGLEDPEDSDVNAIFHSVKVYDDLSARGEDVVIAILSGNHLNMIDGDRKIATDLGDTVRRTGVTSCILVTDGAEDEFVLPIIQSVVPVNGIQRVIVKQMPNLEGTYYIIKKLLEDPKISRQVLVPIGLAMLLYAISYLLGYPEVATIIVVGVIGIYLLFKGFGVDEYFNYFYLALLQSFRGGRFTFVAYISTILLVIVGIVMGLTSILQWYSSEGGVFFYLLSFLYGSVAWFAIAGVIASIGKIVDVYLNEPGVLGRVVVLPFFIIAIGAIAYGASVYTLSISGSIDFPVSADEGIRLIVYTTVGGLLCAFVGVYLQRLIYRWTGHVFALPAREKI
jgi:putative membrane protein